METTKIPVSELPVMAVHCKSCPFKPNEKGFEQDLELASKVTARTLLNSQQICHKDYYSEGKKQYRCKGSFDCNKTIYERMNLSHLLK